MKRILVIGAGRSTTTLIQYLLENAAKEDWYIIVGDLSLSLAAQKVQGTERAEALYFDVHNRAQRQACIQAVDLVISMLPARFHGIVAKDCVHLGKHLLTASYVSEEIKALDQAAKAKSVIMLMECGLDPGIDHMSAMKVIDKIRGEGHQLISFETFTGGLLASNPHDSNPWEYKFTWNPRNVVLAGQGIVKFIQEGKYKYFPYHRLFRRTELIHIPGHGYFEGYANRDSLKYLDIYGLRDLKTLYRGTLRRPGFCKAWNIFVQLGATDDSYQMEGVAEMTRRDFINSFLSYNPHDSVELKLAHYLNLDLDGAEMHKLKWLGVFDPVPIGLEAGTPAQILEHILKSKWTMGVEDRDMIAMWHKFDYLVQGVAKQIQSHMVCIGQNSTHTGMSLTVGLPLGVAAKLILNHTIQDRGLCIPIKKSLYEPILSELQQVGIHFVERETSPSLTPSKE